MTPPSDAFDISLGRPSAARIYHYYLSGEAVFERDRPFFDRLEQHYPYGRDLAIQNREFLRRAVSFMTGQGITQFLDIGCGLPTVGNTHDIARDTIPDARVVYVDYDLEAVNRAHDLLNRQAALGMTAVLDADLRNPSSILDHHETQRLIDFTTPVGLLLVSVLPFLAPADQPREKVRYLLDRLPAGSFVAISHFSVTEADPGLLDAVGAYNAPTAGAAETVHSRDRSEFATFFGDWTLVGGGIVYASDWPGLPISDHPTRKFNLAAVACKP